MTEEELTATVRDLQTNMRNMSDEWGQWLRLEAQRREDEAAQRRRREASESQRAAQDAERWEKSQTFLSKHGAKVAGAIFAMVTSGLAWYGSQIRSEIQAEQRAEKVDKGIEKNTKDLSEFKETTKTDIKALQRESVNQTLMIDKGFDRVDKIMVKATKLKEEDLPEKPQEFKDAVEEAKALKVHADKFGKGKQP